MKQRGFTLIEVMVVIVFGLCIFAFVMSAVNGFTGNGTISWGVNGMTEMRCIDGYKFVIGELSSGVKYRDWETDRKSVV